METINNVTFSMNVDKLSEIKANRFIRIGSGKKVEQVYLPGDPATIGISVDSSDIGQENAIAVNALCPGSQLMVESGGHIDTSSRIELSTDVYGRAVQARLKDIVLAHALSDSSGEGLVKIHCVSPYFKKGMTLAQCMNPVIDFIYKRSDELNLTSDLESKDEDRINKTFWKIVEEARKEFHNNAFSQLITHFHFNIQKNIFIVNLSSEEEYVLTLGKGNKSATMI